MKIKICGAKSLEDIEMINKYEVDYVGFVFAESKRRVSKELAKNMQSVLRKDIKSVGVFMEASCDEINEIASFCKLDIIQLHAKEYDFKFEEIKVPVWKAISMQAEDSIKEDLLEEFEKNENLEGFVLDNAKAGSGESFDWNWVREFSSSHFTILAGGLNPENVQEAISKVRPQVLDVSSGVEEDGKKNENKIRDFVRKVKEYENR